MDYNQTLSKEFKSADYAAVQQVYLAVFDKDCCKKKNILLLELDEFVAEQGLLAKILCYRALSYWDDVEKAGKGKNEMKPGSKDWHLSMGCAIAAKCMLEDFQKYRDNS